MSLSNNEVATGDTQFQHVAEGDTFPSAEDVVAMWRYVGESNVQCHIKGALRALNTLIHLSEKEGALRHFKHALASKDAKANRVALALLRSQIERLSVVLDTAEDEYEEFLKAELLAYKTRPKANPQ